MLEHEHEDHGHGEKNVLKLDDMFNAAKRNELTKLFFEENPSKKEVFYSKLKIASGKTAAKLANNLATGVARLVSDNGDFELGITDDYDFFMDNNTTTGSTCDYDSKIKRFSAPIIPSTIPNVVGDSNIHATITQSSVSAPVYDKVLEPFVKIPVVNNGNYAIKLSNDLSPNVDRANRMNIDITNSYYQQAVKMTKTFVVNTDLKSKVTYSFNFICYNPIDHKNEDDLGVKYDQPRFIARLKDENGIALPSQDCIVADVLNKPMFKCVSDCAGTDTDTPLLYTNWQCSTLEVPEGMKGKTITLEFIVVDCGLGGHYGTVYIDDIDLGDNCEHPLTGRADIDINPIEIGNCPNLPLEVCGIVKAPHSQDILNMEFAKTDKIDLIILKNGIPFNIISTPKSLTNNGLDKNNTFCFDLNASDLDSGKKPEGDYSFYVKAYFSYNDGSTYERETSKNNISFLDCARCCKEEQIVEREVRKTKMDPKQSSIKLTASNIIHNEGYAIYHAGKEVFLSDGFFSENGSKFHGYIEGCTEQHMLKSASETPTKMLCCEDIYRAKIAAENIDTTSKEIALIKIEDFERSDIAVSPNPSTGIFKISILNDVNNGQVKIFDLNGKNILEKEFNEQNEVEIDMTNNASGIYIIQLTLGNEIITKKIIKE